MSTNQPDSISRSTEIAPPENEPTYNFHPRHTAIGGRPSEIKHGSTGAMLPEQRHRETLTLVSKTRSASGVPNKMPPAVPRKPLSLTSASEQALRPFSNMRQSHIPASSPAPREGLYPSKVPPSTYPTADTLKTRSSSQKPSAPSLASESSKSLPQNKSSPPLPQRLTR